MDIFDPMYDSVWNTIRARCAARLRSSEFAGRCDADDLFQQVQLKAWRFQAVYTGTTPQDLLTWLTVMVRTCCIDLHRRNVEAEVRDVRREAKRGADDSPAGVTGSLTDFEPTPSRQAVIHEREAALYAALNRLEEPGRTIVWLYDIEGLKSYQQVTDILNESRPDQPPLRYGKVRRLYLAALERLKEDVFGTISLPSEWTKEV